MEELSLHPAPFDAEAIKDVMTIEGMDVDECQAFKGPTFACLAVMLGRDRIGTAVYSILEGALVVNILACKVVLGRQIATEIEPFFTALAQKEGLTSVRFWTRRKGLARLMEGRGYDKIYVMERQYGRVQ